MKKTSNKGFTLVELIIVIAILAIIMLIAIPNFSGIQQRMQVRADKSTAAQIGKAVRVWFTDFTTDSTLGGDVADNILPAAGTAASGLAVMTGTEPNESATPDAYDKLYNIKEYISEGQKPSSLRAADGTEDPNQFYGVFLTANSTDTAAKIAVAVATKDGDTVKSIGVARKSDGKVDANYNGSAAAVAYVEP